MMSEDDPRIAAGFRRIDIGVADHEFLQNVILNCAGQLILGNALFLGSDDIAGHDRQNRTIHGHGDRHLIQRDPVKQDFHIFNGIDGHAGLTHITNHTRDDRNHIRDVWPDQKATERPF